MTISRRSMLALPMALVVPVGLESVTQSEKIVSVLALKPGDWYIARIVSPPPFYAGSIATQLEAARKWHEAMAAIQRQAELQGLQIDTSKPVEVELLQAGGEPWLPHKGGPMLVEHTAAFDCNQDGTLTSLALARHHRDVSPSLIGGVWLWPSMRARVANELRQVRITVHTAAGLA
jgi:hypothetical protein